MRSISLSILLIAAALSGCVSSGATVPGPTGKMMGEADCNGSPNGCFMKAAKACKPVGGTYQVLDSHSNAGGLIADILPGPITWYHMTYQCGPTDGRLPAFSLRGQQYVPPPVVINQPTAAAPRNCTSTLSGTFVGHPTQINTTCY